MRRRGRRDAAAGDALEGQSCDTSRRRVALLVRTHQLLAHKYSLTADDIGTAVSHHLQLGPGVRQTFDRALAAWQARPAPRTRDRLLDAALAVLEHLKDIILAPAASAAQENIYQKRHIAAGIPSIYGTYTEPKFDALGLSFRVESLVGRLLDDLVEEGIDPYVTRESLRRMAAAIRRMERALAADGADSRALSANLTMLETSFRSHNFTFRQYHNVFQFLANSVTELSTTSVLSHEQVLHTTLTHDPRQCEARGLSVDAAAEMVLREVLVSALGMQDLDRFVAAALRRISLLNGTSGQPGAHAHDELRPRAPGLAAAQAAAATDDQMTLGFKGFGLKQMAPTATACPRASCSPSSCSAPCRRCRTSRSTTTPSSASRRRWRAWSGRPACGSATRRACSCSPSARAPPSPCPGS